MGQARASLYVSTPDTRAIDFSDGEVPITATGFPSLVTTLADASAFDSPDAGRARYTGSNAGAFLVQATVSAYIDAGGVNFDFYLAKNGTVIPASRVLASLAAVSGAQSVPLQARVDLVQNDYVEAIVVASATATLTVDDLSLLVTASAFTPTAGLVSEAQLRAFAGFIPAAADVDDDLAAARALMARTLDAEGLDATLAFQIELRLAAHFAALRFPDGRRKSEREGDISVTYGGDHGNGLAATMYGQMAMDLDPTGLLASTGRPRAEIAFL